MSYPITYQTGSVCMPIRVPKIFGDAGTQPLGMGGVVTRRNMLHLSYNANFGHSRSNNTSVIMQILQKNLTPHPPPPSRSLKVSETNMAQSATSDFLLVIHRKHDHILI